MSLKVLKKEYLSAQTVYFVLGHDSTETQTNQSLPSYTPGAHIQLVLSSGKRKNYSLLGNGTDLNTYEIAVKRLENGQGGSKELIDNYAVGDTISVEEPMNLFPLVSANQYLFIAGGIGITPIISFMKYLLSIGQQNFRLIYLTRTPEEILFKEWIEATIPRDLVIYHHDNGQAENRFDFWTLLSEPSDETIYCCGPKPMMEDVQAMTGHWDEGAVHFEDFGSGGLLSSNVFEPNQEFYVQRRSTGEKYLVRENETILASLRLQGFTIASSCESGTCGTCKMSYGEGEVEHRDFVLSAEERQKNLLICVSRAKSPVLEIDF